MTHAQSASSQLEREIRSLELEIAELKTANQETSLLQKQLQSEREMTAFLRHELAYLVSAVAEEENRALALQTAVSHARNDIDSEQASIDANTAAIRTLQQKLAELRNDRQRAGEY